MSQEYSNPKRASLATSLPDIEVFQLTATEAAAQDEDLVWQYSRYPEYKLCHMNSKVMDAMLEEIVQREEIEGGWFWWSCLPGCLPDGPAMGPFKTYAEALADAREGMEDDEEEDDDSATA